LGYEKVGATMDEKERLTAVEQSSKSAHHRIDALEINQKELDRRIDSIEKTTSKFEAILERLEITVEKLASSIDKARWFLITGVLTPIILAVIFFTLNL
jgi:predicted RNase H-like nuclease (RuvC/YqgF family)